MSAGVVFQQMIIIFILMMTGYILHKRNILGDGASTAFSSLVVNVCNPALLIGSSFERDPSVTNEKLLLVIAAGAVVYAVLLVSAFVIPPLLHVEKEIKNHYALMCIFGNTGFIGIPLVQAVLGSQAVIYAAIFNVYYTLFFYSYGYYLAGGEDSRFSPKNLLNVGNISLVVTVIIFLWQPKVPVLIQDTVNYMSNATTLLAVLVIGINLAKSDLKPIFTQLRLYFFVILRFVVVPILLAMLLRLFIRDELIRSVSVLLAAVPVGNMPLMRVEEIGGDGTVLAQGIILSTILSVVTIPVVILCM
jgi:hypothetical protein